MFNRAVPLFFLWDATKNHKKYTINIEGNNEKDKQGGVESVETREELAKGPAGGTGKPLECCTRKCTEIYTGLPAMY